MLNLNLIKSATRTEKSNKNVAIKCGHKIKLVKS